MESLEQQEKLNDYQHALDSLIELQRHHGEYWGKYRDAINSLRDDISQLEREADNN